MKLAVGGVYGPKNSMPCLRLLLRLEASMQRSFFSDGMTLQSNSMSVALLNTLQSSRANLLSLLGIFTRKSNRRIAQSSLRDL